jgi:AmmeMemoRadiSam system protein A
MHPLVSLAKRSVEIYLKEKRVMEVPSDLPEEFLKRKAGVFVALEKNKKLRGCVGTYLPTKINIAEETIKNSIAAATQDFRFEPVKLEELPEISFSVSVLSYPEAILDINKLDPKKYGIIVKNFPLVFPNQEWILDGLLEKEIVSKTGIIFPGLKGINHPKEQIEIACQKARIDPQKEKFFIYRFTVEKYE